MQELNSFSFWFSNLVADLMYLNDASFFLNLDLQNLGINRNRSFLPIRCCRKKKYSESLYVYTFAFKESKVKALKCKSLFIILVFIIIFFPLYFLLSSRKYVLVLLHHSMLRWLT